MGNEDNNNNNLFYIFNNRYKQALDPSGTIIFDSCKTANVGKMNHAITGLTVIAPENCTTPHDTYIQACPDGRIEMCSQTPLYYSDRDPGLFQDAIFHRRFEYVKKQAEAGDTLAEYELGECYSDGHGIEKSNQDAVKWYSLAAERGDQRAQCRLGFRYECGRGVPASAARAKHWYTLSANQGYDLAQYYLGELYSKAHFYDLAAKWYTAAAMQGDKDAEYAIGTYYRDGKGVIPNLQTAMSWFEKAAKKGHTEAQLILDRAKNAERKKSAGR